MEVLVLLRRRASLRRNGIERRQIFLFAAANQGRDEKCRECPLCLFYVHLSLSLSQTCRPNFLLTREVILERVCLAGPPPPPPLSARVAKCV